MKELLFVFIGGGTGCLFRYGAGIIVGRFISNPFPFSTAIVNILGSYAIGFIVPYFESMPGEFPGWRHLLVIGLLGGFTTFSAFSWDTISIFKSAGFIQAAINFLLNTAGGLIAVLLGIITGKALN